MKNLEKKLPIFSILIYLFSLTQVAFKIYDLGVVKSFQSYEVLLFGGIGFLGGGILEAFVWSANIWFLLALFFTKKKKDKETLFFSLIATIISLSFMFWKEVLAAENGRTAKIVSLEIGYFLWISSIIVLLVHSVIIRLKNT